MLFLELMVIFIVRLCEGNFYSFIKLNFWCAARISFYCLEFDFERLFYFYFLMVFLNNILTLISHWVIYH